jgi:hypothetical protein
MFCCSRNPLLAHIKSINLKFSGANDMPYQQKHNFQIRYFYNRNTYYHKAEQNIAMSKQHFNYASVTKKLWFFSCSLPTEVPYQWNRAKRISFRVLDNLHFQIDDAVQLGHESAAEIIEISSRILRPCVCHKRLPILKTEVRACCKHFPGDFNDPQSKI